MVTLRARLARRKETFARKNQTRNQAGRRASRQPFGKRRWMYPERNNGMRRKDVNERLRLNKERTTMKDIGAWTSGQRLLLGSRGTRMEARYELVSVDIATARMRSIKEWTVWRGRPPPKWLKRKPLALSV
jgi:hypothetical protein